MQWTVVIALLFALVVGLFAVQNITPVTLKFFTYEVSTNLVVVALGAVALGALMIGILGLISQIRAKLQIRTLKGKIKSLEKDLAKVKDERDSYLSEKKNLSIDLARYEGAQEEILAQEALNAVEIEPVNDEPEHIYKNKEEEEI